MKGFIAKTASGLCLCLGLSSLGGCYHYRNLVDPCWPERYNSIAKHNIHATYFAQEAKGHQLEQTIWNWYFEVDQKTGQGSDRLNGAGIERLRTVARTQPAPDFQLFLQNAQDIPYAEGDAPDKVVAKRENLNTRRIQAVQRCLASQTSAPAGNFQIAVHDFTPPGLPSLAVGGYQVPFVSTLGGTGGGGATSIGAGATPGAGSGGAPMPR